jgi:hypothetical protein
VSFATITRCVASQQVFIVVIYFIINSVQNLLDTPLYLLTVKNQTNVHMIFLTGNSLRNKTVKYSHSHRTP